MMVNPSSTANCAAIKAPLQRTLLSQYQHTMPTRNSTMDKSRSINGIQTTARSTRDALSTPSNENSSIVPITAEMTDVIAELQKKPSLT